MVSQSERKRLLIVKDKFRRFKIMKENVIKICNVLLTVILLLAFVAVSTIAASIALDVIYTQWKIEYLSERGIIQDVRVLNNYAEGV